MSTPDLDARTSQFAEACWAFKRGERGQAPTGLEFDLHPYLATAIASGIGVKLEPVHKAQQTMKQQTLL